jgi:ribosomal protein S18 acetylase RimI-like enzyme
MNPKITLRPAAAKDENIVLDIIERTDFFRPVEIDIAREVFIEAALQKPGCTYQSFIAEINGKIAGWVCFGEAPCTLGTFDIYWIAVDPSLQRQGLGKYMLSFSEDSIKQQNGRLAVVETSGMKRYEPTQKFYEKNGYSLAASIPDFYAPGDDKYIYIKTL